MTWLEQSARSKYGGKAGIRALCVAESSTLDRDSGIALLGLFANFGTDVLSFSVTIGPDK